MIFNSPEFLVFLPVVLLLLTCAAKHNSIRDLLLLVASYSFYMAWRWEYAFLILTSTVIDYFAAQQMEKSTQNTTRNILLTISMLCNLGFLCYFKYLNFFLDTLESVSPTFTQQLNSLGHHWLLPVGISFYTFQTMSYTIDVYRREIPAEKNFIRFAVFVSFFPQLVAGPIVRAKDFLPQLQQTFFVSKKAFNAGLFLIFQGLFKKIILADLLAAFAVDLVFEKPSEYSSLELFLALNGYAFQIYNDFSGYSDIAIGTAALFGFYLPENFRKPYLAESLRDFWTRWHISLSTWIRDYLYIPLGGNRKGNTRTLINLMLTMSLAGLWHGAALNFIFWGAFHGTLLIAGVVLSKTKLTKSYPKLLRILITYHLVLLSWLLFRISDIETLQDFISSFMNLTFNYDLPDVYLLILSLAAVSHFLPQRLNSWLQEAFAGLPSPVIGLVMSLLTILFCACTLSSPAFIYFQF